MPIVGALPPKVIEVSEVASFSKNAQSPIEVTVLGKVIDSSGAL